MGPEKDFELSENIAIQPCAMGPTPMVEGPPGATDTLSSFGRESNADITPLVSETPDRIISPNAINQPVGPTALTESAKELDIPQPDSSDAYTNEAALALLPHPDTGNSWANLTSEFGQTPLLQVFPYDIPQPNSCDAWTTAVAPAPSQLFDANATIHRVDGAASIPLLNSTGDNIPYTVLSDPYGATMNASERSPPHPFGLFPSATT